MRRTVSEAPEGMRGARPDMSTKTVIVEELVDSEDEEVILKLLQHFCSSFSKIDKRRR